MPTSIDSATANVPTAANNANGINFQAPLGFALSQQVSFIYPPCASLLFHVFLGGVDGG